MRDTVMNDNIADVPTKSKDYYNLRIWLGIGRR